MQFNSFLLIFVLLPITLAPSFIGKIISVSANWPPRFLTHPD